MLTVLFAVAVLWIFPWPVWLSLSLTQIMTARMEILQHAMAISLAFHGCSWISGTAILVLRTLQYFYSLLAIGV